MTLPSRTALRDALDQTLSVDELKDLCVDLDIDYANLPADTKVGKARELVLFLERRSKLPLLVDWIQQNREATAQRLGLPYLGPASPGSSPAPSTPLSPPSTSPSPVRLTWEYNDFEIIIGDKSGETYPVRVISAVGGTGQMRLSFEDQAIKDGLRTLEGLRLDETVIKAMGHKMLDALLVGGVDRAFYQTLGGIEQGEGGLRLRLRIDSPELKRLPWEYLYDADRNSFLALRTRIAVSRYLEVSHPLFAVSKPDTLRILVILSNPQDVTTLDLAQEEQKIRAALKKLTDSNKVALEVLPNPTVREIRQRLRTAEYHVVHYSGHAVFAGSNNVVVRQEVREGGQTRAVFLVQTAEEAQADPTRHLKTVEATAPSGGTGYVILPDTIGNARSVDESAFADLFTDYRSIRLVVLNACEGAQGASGERLSGIGERIIQTVGIPSVVAMQYEIEDDAAIEFATEFYSALADALPIDAAVTQGRQALRDSKSLAGRAWGTPVLFMRARDGKLFA